MVDVRELAVRLRRRHDRGPIPAEVCRAPFTSMYLDQHGSVRACCQNTEHPLGNVTEQRLRDIWDGPQAKELRDAMLAHNLERGCAFCKWQVAEGNKALVFARTFDHLQVDSLTPQWPKQLELSMSNACNLQCVMCNGDWSSSIRANREGRPPLPQVYDEQFFEDLRPFLEHVEVVKILGGEPFLGRESLRVMEMLVEMGSTAEVHVTTNGTQWTPRVERILERLPMVIVLSLDGIDRESYESIRIGADIDEVLTNLDRFLGYAERHGTSVNVSHCLMTSNWRRFPDFLRYTEARGLRTYVNTVTYPTSLSLFHMPAARLREVVETYEAIDAELSDELSLNRPLWKDQLARLRTRLDGLRQGQGVDYYLGVLGFPLIADLPSGVAAAREAAESVADGPIRHVAIDIDRRIVALEEGPDDLLGVPLTSLTGRHLEAILDAMAVTLGEATLTNPVADHLDVRHWRMGFASSDRAVSAFISPVRDDEGVITEFHGYFAVEPAEFAEPPASTLAHQADEFAAAYPGVHRISVGADHHVVEVEPSSTPLGQVLGRAVGRLDEELFAVLMDEFGDVVDSSDEARADGAAYYRVAMSNDRGTSTITSLVMPQPTSDLGAAGSVILVALTDAPVGA